ncbi:MarR family transcriptional regulator [Neorhizobium lilium]|uniref:MarR family transcriptional regulator n=1 Tax=Neorhizobium lilium TaxID=2503024 RepID=A0A444LBS3_9HYPH|nr:MarR family winged helix-turn-helix transcriptional regulator [Neorhizobium lilium]RWX75132.1 MarR family transcriptional regulator [Neorhizobium lilium]
MKLSDNRTHPPADIGQLAFLIGDAARLLRTALEKRVAQSGLGLTPGEARALINIAATDGSRQLDIALRMGVEPMTLCTYLDKLQALGLVERQPCTVDRRAKRINLTPASIDMLAAIRQELGDILARATQGMDEERCDLLAETLKSFNANLQTFNHGTPDEQND